MEDEWIKQSNNAKIYVVFLVNDKIRASIYYKCFINLFPLTEKFTEILTNNEKTKI